MANKVYNLNGGLYSGDAFTAFETRIASSNNGSIVASPSDLKVSAGSGMNVTVSTGAGIIGNGTLSGVRFAIDAPVTVAVNAASTANPRMDSVVAYIDKSVSASTSVVDNTDLGIVKFKSVAGTPSATPSAPTTSTIQSSIGAGNPYMILANITVPKSASAASSFTITDTRITPTSAIITDSSITTTKLANKAVTSDKVDWTTLKTGTPKEAGSGTASRTITANSVGFMFINTANAFDQYCTVYLNGTSLGKTSGGGASSFAWSQTTVFVAKGDVVRITTSDNGGNSQITGVFFVPIS